MASKQPRRSNLNSDLKFMAQTIYATKFVWNDLTFFDHFERRKKKERRTHLPLLDLSASPQVKTPERSSCLLMRTLQNPGTKS